MAAYLDSPVPRPRRKTWFSLLCGATQGESDDPEMSLFVGPGTRTNAFLSPLANILSPPTASPPICKIKTEPSFIGSCSYDFFLPSPLSKLKEKLFNDNQELSLRLQEYAHQSKVVLYKLAHSADCAAGLFVLNLLLFLWRLVRPSTVCNGLHAPSLPYLITTMDVPEPFLMNDITTARKEIVDHFQPRKIKAEKRALAVVEQALTLGDAVVNRVEMEYEAILAEMRRDNQICQLPFAHLLNPVCPVAFDVETHLTISSWV